MLERIHSATPAREPLAVHADERARPAAVPSTPAPRLGHLQWDWDAYRHFVVLARCGVMRRAAQTLGVSVATLSRRIEQLEGVLGLCLFQRRPHGIELTMAGRQVLANCEHISDAFGLLEQSMKDGGTVMDHVNLSVDSMLARLLLPALPPFLAAHAGITVHLTTFCANRQETTGEADLTFGFTRPDRGRRRIRRLAELTMSMAVSAARRERDELPAWSFRDGIWYGRQISGSGSTELCITHLEDVANLVRNGFGAAMLPDYMIGAPASGLARLDRAGTTGEPVLPVWMSLLETASRSSAVRALAAICSEVIQAHLPPARVETEFGTSFDDMLLDSPWRTIMNSRDRSVEDDAGPWLRAVAAYAPATRVSVEDAIGQGWYGADDHAKDGYRSVAVEQHWWPADMGLATARAALDAAGSRGERLAQLSYASIHRHGHARLWQPAAYLQRVLRASQALAFSLSHGCNGMFVAARLALDMLRDETAGEALVVGADRFGTSRFDRWRGDYGVLYGDAAAAALFGRSPGFARVRHLSIVGVPELEGMHRHDDEHLESAAHAALEFGVRASKKAFIERYGRERFFEAIGAALGRLRENVLAASDLGARPADWLITPHLGRAITVPLYAGRFRDLAVSHDADYGLAIGHTGTADPFASLAALARGGQLENGQRVLLVDSGAGFSCGLMLLDIVDVSLATQCGDLHSLLSDLDR